MVDGPWVGVPPGVPPTPTPDGLEVWEWELQEQAEEMELMEDTESAESCRAIGLPSRDIPGVVTFPLVFLNGRNRFWENHTYLPAYWRR